MIPVQVKVEGLESINYLIKQIGLFQSAYLARAMRTYFETIAKPAIIKFTPTAEQYGRMISEPGIYDTNKHFIISPFTPPQQAIEQEPVQMSYGRNTVSLQFGSIPRLNKKIQFGWKATWREGTAHVSEHRTTTDSEAHPMWQNTLIQRMEVGGPAFTVKPRHKGVKIVTRTGRKVYQLTKRIPPQRMAYKGVWSTRKHLRKVVKQYWLQAMTGINQKSAVKGPAKGAGIKL